MAEKRKSPEPEKRKSVQDARRHVGRTLESEGNFDKRMGTAVPIRHADGGSKGNETDNLEVRRVPPDADEGNAADAAAAGRASSRTPPLRTRLADDTSSDPHTDVGPNNATTVQKRPERKRGSAA